MTDSSREGGTKVYDSRKQGGVTARGVKLDQKPYTPPKPTMFALPPRDWGSRRLWSSVLDVNGDVGLLLGVGVSRERYGFRRNPFAYRWSTSLAFATKLQNFRFSAAYDVTRENSKIFGSVEFLLSGIESMNFYGYGVGLWIAPLIRQLTMSLAVAGSDEGPRVYFRFGFGF